MFMSDRRPSKAWVEGLFALDKAVRKQASLFEPYQQAFQAHRRAVEAYRQIVGTMVAFTDDLAEAVKACQADINRDTAFRVQQTAYVLAQHILVLGKAEELIQKTDDAFMGQVKVLNAVSIRIIGLVDSLGNIKGFGIANNPASPAEAERARQAADRLGISMPRQKKAIAGFQQAGDDIQGQAKQAVVLSRQAKDKADELVPVIGKLLASPKVLKSGNDD